MTRRQNDILSKLADVGEEAVSRVAGSTATSRLIDSVGGMRERLDDVQKKVRGLDALERRVEKLEKRVADLDKPSPARSTGTARSRATTAKKPSGTSKSAGTSGGAARTTPRKKPSSPS